LGFGFWSSDRKKTIGGTMNVAFDPWIPVVTLSGERKLVSLGEVLTNGSGYADLAVRPHERVSLMRLFLCVAHAALNGPKDHKEWREVPKKLPNAVEKYLDKWKDSFELFHKKKPWLQVATISKLRGSKRSEDNPEEWTPVSKLNFSFATGNNSTLFDHGGLDEDRKIALEETIVSMLAFQCFSSGGLIAQVYWNGKQTKKTSKDSPCLPGSMVHTLLRENTLLDSIQANLPLYKDVRLTYDTSGMGKPVWEMVPTSFSDSRAIENATATYLGRLVPMTRLIRLHPSGARMLLGDGLVYPTHSDGFPPEPTATVIIRKNGEREERAVLSFRPSKALWRELHAIIVRRRSDGLGGPLALRAIQDDRDCDLVVAALARDQATILDTIESVFHIPSKLRSPQGTVAYEEEVKTAEVVASRLGWAVGEYRKTLDGGWEGRLKSAGPSKGELLSKLYSIATSHYWTVVERNLSLLFTHVTVLGTDDIVPTRSAWRKMLIAAGRGSYELACGQETPRQMKAFAEGWQKLVLTEEYLDKILNQSKEEKS
jgi:CRISPR system Cascade subunit CasA